MPVEIQVYGSICAPAKARVNLKVIILTSPNDVHTTETLTDLDMELQK